MFDERQQAAAGGIPGGFVASDHDQVVVGEQLVGRRAAAIDRLSLT